jgi:hypothetical protein
MRRRILLGCVAAMSLLTGFLWADHFDLEWDEEVQLPNGPVVVVHRKQTYERLSPGLTPYGGTSIPRDTTLTIDTGGPAGRVTQLFKGFDPLFLGRDKDTWYAVLIGGYYYKSREIPGQDWGDQEGPYGQRAVKLVGNKFVPISLLELPETFQTPNMLLLYGNAKELSKFDGKKVTLADKSEWQMLHPPGYAHVELTRPKSSKRIQSNASPTTEKGEQK